MRWSSPGVKWMLACAAGVVATTGPIRGEEPIRIYSLNDGALCRDLKGKIVTPHVVPRLPVAAERAFDMIKVTGGLEGQDCYFYTSEAGLAQLRRPGLTLCPDASVGTEKSANLAGTRDVPEEGCSK
jgi:hypothetical protein